MKKDIYKKLKKIKKPVLIALCEPNSDSEIYRSLHRVRILYPDGRVEYTYDFSRKGYELNFAKSCFLNGMTKLSLSKTINAMKNYDLIARLKVVEVINL